MGAAVREGQHINDLSRFIVLSVVPPAPFQSSGRLPIESGELGFRLEYQSTGSRAIW